MPYPKKLIEVALPLEAINVASAREKSIRHGHPSTLHLWWARRPLAAARAVIFSQMVDDPSEYVDELLAAPDTRKRAEKEYQKQAKAWDARKVVFDKAQAAGMTPSANPDPGPRLTLEGIAAGLERERLFRIIEQLVLWENTTDEKVLQAARDEINRSWRRTCAQNADHPRAAELFNPEKLPAFHDPFAGGGALPLEAQRLGLEAYASDLNPVAVLINKAMIEIPPKFAGMPPVHPLDDGPLTADHKKSSVVHRPSSAQPELIDRKWRGAQGLAEDVRYYGQWMRDEAEKRIGHLYPKVEISAEMVAERPDLKKYLGQKLTVIAWLWARTVKSPNPAFAHVDVPLASTFMLSTKAGKEAYVEPVIEKDGYRFTVKVGKPEDAELATNGTKLARGANFQCLMSGVPVSGDYIKAEGQAGRMGARLMAVVAEGSHERLYLSAIDSMEAIAQSAKPEWKPETPLAPDLRALWTPPYGLSTYGDLFTPRQLVELTTIAGLVEEVRELVERDAQIVNGVNDLRLVAGGTGSAAYADAITIYLAFAFDKLTTASTTICTWQTDPTRLVAAFSRQGIPMTWDYAEANAFGGAAGDFHFPVLSVTEVLPRLPAFGKGFAYQQNAQNGSEHRNVVISTDPPYYDNIGYADLSDFFYVWMRRVLKSTLPDLFTTLAVPKTDELVAIPYRHGSKQKAEVFFLNGMSQTMKHLSQQAHQMFPITIYYAFKQSETKSNTGTASTGWETFLDAVIQSGFAITGTWPMRTELTVALKKTIGALASSIVLVCRPQSADAPTATRRDFVSTLKAELPAALAHLQAGNIAPVDLAQAAIGPGMAVYTRYAKVLDAQGQPLTVRQALALINETLDEALAEQEGDFDADTRWALAWFEQSGFAEGEFGVADVLARAKDTSVAGMVEAGILASSRGKVRLLKPAELPGHWDPAADTRLTAWEMVHHLVRVLEASGESAASALVAKLGGHAETARELCYRLYTICERKKRNAEALSYNGLVQSWPEIVRLARESRPAGETQAPLL